MTNLHDGELMANQKGENSSRDDEELHAEGVSLAIVGNLKLVVDEVHRAQRRGHKDDLQIDSR